MATIPAGTAADVDAAVAAAKAAFGGWSTTPVEERAKYLTRIGDALGARHGRDRHRASRRRPGWPSGCRSSCRSACRSTASTRRPRCAEAYAFEETVGNSLVVREPIGVVGCITPWNYPLHQIAAKVAYAMAAGCTVVLKPSEVAPARRVHPRRGHRRGRPAGRRVQPRVRRRARWSARRSPPTPTSTWCRSPARPGPGGASPQLGAETIKKVALELGGKSANVLLDDLDEAGFAKAVGDGVGKAFLNSGQTCSALTRMLVPRDRLAEAERIAAAAAEHDRRRRPVRRGRAPRPAGLGGPARAGAGLHPEGHRRGRHARRRRSRRARGPRRRLLRAPDGVLQRHARHDDRPGGDLRAGAVDHAVRRRGRRRATSPTASSTASPAACGRPTPDRARAVARRLRTGQVEINGGAFNPNAPFGGYKQSGIGREYGRYGLEEFLEIKSIQQ